jgi:nicotinamide-nucleotide amidase
MIAEILSTGDEICSGAVIDSNAAHIAEKLMDLDIAVVRHTCVGDDAGTLAAVLQEIAGRADLAVVSGGLGPTKDDLSAEAAASAAGVELETNSAAAAYIETFFESYGRRPSPSDYKQAILPRGAAPICNARGTAPGFRMEIRGCRLYFLPGIPLEMAAMLEEQVLPEIGSEFESLEPACGIRTLSVFGLPESRVNDRLSGIEERFPGIRYGLLARFPVIYIKLIGPRKTSKAPGPELDSAVLWVREKLGTYLFSERGCSMEEEVAQLLFEKRATVALAESCTGGLAAHLLTNVPGSSEYFLLSAVTYANRSKIDFLGLDPELIETRGAVHEETARAMAEGVRRVAGADYGLATSGIAGPGGGSREKPVGTVCIGIAGPSGAGGERLHSPFRERLANKQMFAVMGLNVLRKSLLAS